MVILSRLGPVITKTTTIGHHQGRMCSNGDNSEMTATGNICNQWAWLASKNSKVCFCCLLLRRSSTQHIGKQRVTNPVPKLCIFLRKQEGALTLLCILLRASASASSIITSTQSIVEFIRIVVNIKNPRQRSKIEIYKNQARKTFRLWDVSKPLYYFIITYLLPEKLGYSSNQLYQRSLACHTQLNVLHSK